MYRPVQNRVSAMRLSSWPVRVATGPLIADHSTPPAALSAHDGGLPGPGRRAPSAAERRARPPRPPPAGQHPGVLGTAALAGVHHEVTFAERDPGQAARQHPHPVPVVDGERPQIDVARRQASRRSAPGRWTARPAAAPSSSSGCAASLARDHREVTLVGARADHDAAAPGAIHGFQHQAGRPIEHPAQHLGIVEPVGLDVGRIGASPR